MLRAFWIGLVFNFVVVVPTLAGFAGWYMLAVPGHSQEGVLPDATSAERDLADRLRTHVSVIASAPRNVQNEKGLERAALYIEQALLGFGYVLDRQIFEVDGATIRNIEAKQVTSAGSAASTLVIGAHYDSYEDSPGANDNGTGTAALIELAGLLRDHRPQGTQLRFVFFVNEEPPYYRTPDMGSWRYAKSLAERGEAVRGMISLETLGVYSDDPGSQRYPPPFGMIFPSKGNFVAFVGLPGGRPFLHEVIASFRRNKPFPTIGGVGPDILAGFGLSDHWAFHQFGFPALMITDTAYYRYPHYHLPTDTPDRVDHEKLARVVHGLEQVVREIAR
jgi:hypothetical protein